MEESQTALDKDDSALAQASSDLQHLEAQKQDGDLSSDEAGDVSEAGAQPHSKRRRRRKPSRSTEEAALWAEFEDGIEAQVKQTMQSGGVLPDLTSATQQLAQKLAGLCAPCGASGAAANSGSLPAEASEEKSQAGLYGSWEDEPRHTSRAGPYERAEATAAQVEG